MRHRLLLVGEPMGLFLAEEKGTLDEVSSYAFAVAGAEYNVAVGMKRLGHEAGYLTRLGEDPFGRHIYREMERNGIDVSMVSFSKDAPTGFMLKSQVEEGDPDIFYFRKGSAASQIGPPDIAGIDMAGYSHLHLTGIFPALSPSAREAAFALLSRARQAGMAVSLDPNLRPALWPDTREMVSTIHALAGQADWFLPGIAEGRLLSGEQTPEGIAAFYHRMGVKLVIIKLGAKGAYFSSGEEEGYVEGFSVPRIVDTVGAGDGFAAGVLSAWIEGLPVREAVRRGNAIGAIQVMSRGDNSGLPTREELERFMKESKGE